MGIKEGEGVITTCTLMYGIHVLCTYACTCTCTFTTCILIVECSIFCCMHSAEFLYNQLIHSVLHVHLYVVQCAGAKAYAMYIIKKYIA